MCVCVRDGEGGRVFARRALVVSIDGSATMIF